MEEEIGIVIVGAGLCGLATALALHRKGIRSVVLERAPELRSEGSAIALHANAWRVLDRLGVADELRRRNTVALSGVIDSFLHRSGARPMEVYTHELRFVRRMDVVSALATALPPGTVRFNCDVSGIVVRGRETLFPTVLLADGRTIKAKVLIGADGGNSAVARTLGLPLATPLPCWMVRGLTSYPSGHPYGDRFVRIHGPRTMFGRVAVDDNLMHFFIGMFPPFDGNGLDKGDKALIKKICVTAAVQAGYPAEVVEIMENCNVESLSLTRIWWRAPWHINPFRCQKGTVTVAGDAMHVMGPFLGQAAAAGMEDAVVLARLLSEALLEGGSGDDRRLAERVEKAQRRYVRERLVRSVGLALHTVLICTFLETQSKVKKAVCALAMAVLFGGITNARHILHDCGPL